MNQLKDIDVFLESVDKISDLVHELHSSDIEAQQRAVEKSDQYLAGLDETCITKVNTTKINTSASSSSPWPSTIHQHAESPDYFMKIMEKDAEERWTRRKAKEERANVFKEKGNLAYAKDDFENAVKYYSDGLVELRDMQPLYTNRAQAYIKLGKYKEAISDCEWAIKCNERCIKAYVHMGKAHLALKNWNEARDCFGKILEFEPGRETMIKEYLTQVDFEEVRESQERSAREALDKGEEKATAVPLLLERLSRSNQTSFYYYGGLELLSQAITDCTGQTLFRLNSGFSIISNNDTVKSCLLQNSVEPYTKEVCVSVLRLWRLACQGNDENQKMLITCPASSLLIVDLLTSEHIAVQTECLALLCLYSQMPYSRNLAIDNLNVLKFVKNLMACILAPKGQQKTALAIMENFASENKFCMKLRDILIECVVIPFTAMLRNISKSNWHILPPLISVIGCLARDNVICSKMANYPECWEALVVAMKQCCSEHEYREILPPLLGLMITLSAITSPAIQEHAVNISSRCLELLSNTEGVIITRATGVLSMILPQSPAAVEHVVQGGVVKVLSRLLKFQGTGQKTIKHGIKTLATCTHSSHRARQELVKSDKRLSVLCCLLGSGCDEMVSGNAALCLGHCLELQGCASNLLGTDIVMLLLHHAARDNKKTAVQQNAAIALGKLCQNEPRHLNKLRELHGFEILHSCMKHIT